MTARIEANRTLRLKLCFNPHLAPSAAYKNFSATISRQGFAGKPLQSNLYIFNVNLLYVFL
jgi:hypothetical protein